MSLAIVDGNGPWVSDVVYVNDGTSLYWLSEEKTRHSQAILKNPKVAVAITLSNRRGEKNVGLQIEGMAKKVEGNIYEMAVKHRLKRKKEPPRGEERFLDEGESWYKLTPTKIELIHEPKFGYNKKVLEI